MASAGALAVTAVPAFASTGSDRRLLQLCRNYLRLERAYGRVCLILDDVEQECWAKEKQRDAKRKQKPMPPRPVELTGVLDVWPEATGPFGLVDLADKDVRETLVKIADGSWTIFACFIPGMDRKSMKWIAPPDEAKVRARELLAIYDDWVVKGGGEPKPRRQRRSPALVKVDRTLNRIHALQESVANAIAATPARTMAGIRAKFDVLSACASCLDGSDVYDPDSEYLMAIRNSALADVLRIEPGSRLNPPSLKEALVASLQERVLQ
jgi:hypothetical protein